MRDGDYRTHQGGETNKSFRIQHKLSKKDKMLEEKIDTLTIIHLSPNPNEKLKTENHKQIPEP